MRWAAATLLLTSLAGTTSAQGGPENPLPDAVQRPSATEQTQVIEKARTIALEYTGNLPNFVATETVRRQFLSKGARTWKAEDTLLVDVAFVEGDERYTLLTINGKPTRKTLDSLDGVNFGGEFGSFLLGVFQLKAEAKFKWERWTTLQGRPAHVFSYHIEKDRSGFSMYFDTGHKGSLPFGGLVYVDRETHQVLRFTSEAEIPADWPATGMTGELDYGFAEVDGKPFLLPLHAEMRIHWRAGAQSRSVTEFGNYHKFSTGVTITAINPSSVDEE